MQDKSPKSSIVFEKKIKKKNINRNLEPTVLFVIDSNPAPKPPLDLSQSKRRQMFSRENLKKNLTKKV